MRNWRWLSGLGLVCIVAAFVPRVFFTADLPEAFRIARGVAPWRWSWLTLLRLGIQGFGLVLGYWGVGRRCLNLWRTGSRPTAFHVAQDVGLGVASTGTFVFGLGLAGLLQPGVLLVIYVLTGAHAVLLLAGIVGRHGWGPTRRKRKEPWGDSSRARRGFTLLTIWIGWFLLADLLAPEGYWDVLISHLGIPMRYLEAHKAWHAPPFFGQMPLLVSFDYLFALSLYGEGLARVLNMTLSALLLICVWRMVRRLEDSSSAWLAAALLITCPLFGLLGVHAGADCAVAVFGILGFMALIEAAPRWPTGTFKPGWLILAGIWAGCAGGVKLPGFSVAVALTIAAAPFGIRACGLIVAPALMVISPWMVRAWLLTGNPVYPLLHGVFPGPFWSSFSIESYGEELRKVLYMFGFGDLSISGEATTIVKRFQRGITGPIPAIAVLAAWIAVLRREHMLPMRRLALAGAAMMAGLWCFSVPAYRFYLAGFVLLLTVPPFGDVRRPEWRWCGWLVALIQAVWFPIAIHQTDDPWAAARGEESRPAYYERMYANGVMDAVHVLEEHLRTGPRARVLAVGEVRNYLLPSWSIVSSYFEPTPLLVWAGESVDARRLHIKLKQHGVRYLLVNAPEMLRRGLWEGLCWQGPVRTASLMPWFHQHAQLAYARRAGWVYEIREHAGGAPVPECLVLRPEPAVLTGLVCASASQGFQARHDRVSALRFAWAATAAAPRVGLSWMTLADALFATGRYQDAIGAYMEALDLGWRTSAGYRNLAIALTSVGRAGPARNALDFAENLDPESVQIQRDLRAVSSILFAPAARERRASAR